MSQSDGKHGNATQTGNDYSPRGPSKAERYGKRLVMTFLDFTNAPNNLEVKWVNLLSWTISKVKVASFLLGLTLTFLVMASYVLTWDRKGLFTPPPYQVRPAVIPTGTVGSEVSSEKSFIDMKLLVKSISSKLEYAPRKVPDEKDVIGTDSHVSLEKWFESCELLPCHSVTFHVLTKAFSTHISRVWNIILSLSLPLVTLFNSAKFEANAGITFVPVAIQAHQLICRTNSLSVFETIYQRQYEEQSGLGKSD